MTQRPTSPETPEAAETETERPEAIADQDAGQDNGQDKGPGNPPPVAAAAPEKPKAAAPAPGASRPAPREPAKRAAPVPPAPAQKLQPSWVLSASGEQLSREELLARYRRQRALPDDPFENGMKPSPPPGYRERIMNAERPAARFLERPAPEAAAAAPRGRSFTLGQTFAIAAAMALVAGAGAGVMSARFSGPTAPEPAPASLQAAAMAPAADAAPVVPLPAQPAQAEASPANNTVIDKKPVSTATLQVADVSGETNSYIPLALHAEPGGNGEDMLLKISGVPEGAYLTSGHRDDDQMWSLSLAELKDLRLVVPEAKNPEIDLAVAAFEPGTGELAAPVKTMTVALKDVVVEPTSAPPPPQDGSAALADGKSALPVSTGSALPVAIPPPKSIAVAALTADTTATVPETAKLLGEADALFKSGDVRAARKAYERAWGTDGSAAAAFGIARSYDPVVLASLALKNAKPDKGQAVAWYQRAAAGGNPDATEAIVRLQLKP